MFDNSDWLIDFI